ncbi:MAG: CSLREA domain-containing protein, partial [Candidatus Marinimicrobia bacterium]|nr:CSLREA domain-containing protein [Candidatus Neomarinimicrobiota bacterium]MBT5270901.1 CSLREA domain-containing protein [Candidatus Neomarinimicrobiota bacterium]
MINVADPTTPLEIGYFPTPDGALWVEVVDTIAYVAERYAGIQILDISDLTAPDSIGMFEVDYADAINIQGDSLYLASSIGGIKLIDISDPISPVLLNENPGGGYALDVYTSGDYTYVSHRNMGVGVYHISEEGSLLQVGYIELEAPYKLSGSGSNLYVADGGNLQIIDVEDPANPQIINTWNEGWVNNVIVYRRQLYLVGHPDLQILNASDPYNLELVGSLDGLPSSPYELALNNGFLYLASRSGGLNIVDVRDSASPQHISNLDGFSYTWSVAVSGKYAYVADRDNGEVRAIDVSNPEEPFDAGGIAIGSRVEDVQVSGRFVYGLDAWEGVRIIDFADPINPLEVGYFNTGGFSKGLYNDWGRIAVADGGGGLYLLETYIQSPNFTVNSTGDESDTDPGDGNCDVGNGDCTLRAAIEEANAYPGYNIIFFDIPGEGPHYIQPNSELPAVEDPVDINGRSEPDYAYSPVISIQGSNTGGTGGLSFTYDASFSRIIGVNVSGFEGGGIYLMGNGQSIILCYIGTDVAGSSSQGNAVGVEILGTYNRLNANVISGNSGPGVSLFAIPEEDIECHHNVLRSNNIGTDATGSFAVPNDGDGIYIGEETHHNVVGDGNVISGNATRGIWLSGAWDNVIRGNLVGTDASGTIALGNGSDQHGIVIGSGSHHNVIGGQFETEGNVISGHDGFGVALWNEGTQFNQILGNKIGVDVTGEAALG